MTDDELDEAIPDHDALVKARAEVREAIGRYADGWSTTEGSVIVGFVAVAQLVGPDGTPGRIEISGSAADDHDLIPAMRYGLLFGYLFER